MSLDLAAKHLARYGRNGDDTLIHVSRKELGGLGQLAKRNGKELTVNPQTGLPEAFSLGSILPMIAGAGLAMTGIGAPAAALIVAAEEGIRNKSLEKGLMAGLGAYGGAGIAGGLAGAGAEAAGSEAASQAAAQTASETAAAETAAASAAAPIAPAAVDTGLGAVDLTSSAGVPAAASAPSLTPTFSENLSYLGQGAKNLGTTSGWENFVGSPATANTAATGMGGGMQAAKYGLAAYAPIADSASQVPNPHYLLQ